MGELILCTYKRAERPFIIPDSGFKIYTLEELCYYLEDNFYLLDKKVLNYSLCRWLSQEIGLFRLGAELEKMLRSGTSVYPGVLLVMKKSGFYRDEELEQLRELFETMDGKTVLECRKVKGDQYLKQEKYALAAAEYRRLLKPENRMRMTDELCGFLYHNLGVAYARMFLFPEAAECFKEAYQQNRQKESREAYLYALNYIKGEKPENNGFQMNLDFETMREVFGKFQDIASNGDYYKERQKLKEIMNDDSCISEEDKKKLLAEWKHHYKEISPFS